MTNNNVLVINGKRYDATTGQLLGSEDQIAPKARSIDGLSQPKKSKSAEAKKQTVYDKKSELPSAPQQPSARRGHAHDIILSKAVHSTPTAKPLMRPSKCIRLQTSQPITTRLGLKGRVRFTAALR